jgi:putative sterol carrier protein
MTDFDLSSIRTMEPGEFSKLVKSTSDEKINEVMTGENRTEILDEIFSRFPKLFRADRAGSTNAVIHWAISGRPDGGDDTYQVVIENGICTTSSEADREPRLTISLGPADFIKVVSGAGNPMMMFMTGKLKAKGDMGLAANIANLFDLPKG